MKKKFLTIVLALCAFSAAIAEERTVDCGSTVQIKAEAKSGYRFIRWSDDVKDNPRTFANVQEAQTLQAIFAQEFNISISATDGGSVNQTGGILITGESITVTAKPDECYEFVKWSDGVTDATRTITANSSLTTTTFKAEFKLKTFKFTYSAEDDSMGSVSFTVL